jgi:hypothetical protein
MVVLIRFNNDNIFWLAVSGWMGAEATTTAGRQREASCAVIHIIRGTSFCGLDNMSFISSRSKIFHSTATSKTTRQPTLIFKGYDKL